LAARRLRKPCHGGINSPAEGSGVTIRLLPEYLDDYVAEDNPVRVIDVFVDELDLGALGIDGVIA
jgi:hypothetical protein